MSAVSNSDPHDRLDLFMLTQLSATGPQGGLKASGWGRQNALWGLEEFLEEKSITWHGK